MRNKPQQRPEQWRDNSFALGGGLDETSSALEIRPGRLLQCLNWEENFGKQGYSTIRGYERFSGKPSPSGVKVDQELRDEFPLTSIPAALIAARNLRRSVITQPAGSGPVRGVVVFNDAVYCVRNATNGATATLWKSTNAGWDVVKTGLDPDGSYRFKVANFTGTPEDKALYGVNGRGRLFRVTIDGTFTYAAPIFGTEATSNSSLTIGLGSKVFAIIETTRGYKAGQVIVAHDRANTANFMVGTFVSYAGNNLTINVATVSGSGTIAAWELGLADYSDRPYLIEEFRDHLWLAYPKGQLQSSNLGDPLTYTTTATAFGMGDEITDLTVLKGNTLAVFGRQKLELIGGTSQLDWNQETHTESAGAIAGTVQGNNGNAIFLDDKGLTTLQATQNFGDFEPSILSANARATLNLYQQQVDGPLRIVGSRMAKRGYQYRLYFDDGAMLRCTIRSGNPVLTPEDVSFTLQKYLHVPTCFASGVMNGVDRMFFGTADGWVMEEDAGTSFDGEPIYYSIKLPFNHCKSPSIEKRFHKAEIELETEDAVTVFYRQSFNYDDGVYRHGGNQMATTQGQGGLYDVDSWDTFFYDEPTVTRVSTSLNGVGQNMGLLIWFESNYVRPVTLQGIQLFFSMLGLKR